MHVGRCFHIRPVAIPALVVRSPDPKGVQPVLFPRLFHALSSALCLAFPCILTGVYIYTPSALFFHQLWQPCFPLLCLPASSSCSFSLQPSLRSLSPVLWLVQLVKQASPAPSNGSMMAWSQRFLPSAPAPSVYTTAIRNSSSSLSPSMQRRPNRSHLHLKPMPGPTRIAIM